ncbi:MAG: DUF2934 domain-containing protein [Methyloglobulus sp.]|nr:DUF2934 domain-containing protein [Methyloglobulus sp.]
MAKVKNIEENFTIQETNKIMVLSDLDAKIAAIAYYKAEIRGFVEGHELDDWLEAEQELNLS